MLYIAKLYSITCNNYIQNTLFFIHPLSIFFLTLERSWRVNHSFTRFPLFIPNGCLYLYEHGCHRILNSHCCAIFSLQHFTNPIYLMGTILKPYHLQLTPVTGGMGYELWVRFSDKKEDWLGVSLLLDSGDTYCLKFLLCF